MFLGPNFVEVRRVPTDLIEIYDGFPEVVLLLVEISHADLEERV
jgi:hypothetical protein